MKKGAAPGEARTHGLQIMRLTRCRLRYRGVDKESRLENTLLILITGIRIATTKITDKVKDVSNTALKSLKKHISTSYVLHI